MWLNERKVFICVCEAEWTLVFVFCSKLSKGKVTVKDGHDVRLIRSKLFDSELLQCSSLETGNGPSINWFSSLIHHIVRHFHPFPHIDTSPFMGCVPLLPPVWWRHGKLVGRWDERNPTISRLLYWRLYVYWGVSVHVQLIVKTVNRGAAGAIYFP